MCHAQHIAGRSDPMSHNVTIVCHIIDRRWKPKHVDNSWSQWVTHGRECSTSFRKITCRVGNRKKKMYAIVTDSATNVINAVSQLLELNDNMDRSQLTCAAHFLRSAVNKALSDDETQSIVTKSSKIVGHFKHSSIAMMKALEKTQQQLNKPKSALLQYCKTR